MTATTMQKTWRDHLPAVRGSLTFDAPLRNLTWFRVGGPAEVLFRPADRADLAEFLKALPESVPVTVLGVGSNLLVRDGGVDGVVIRLGRGFSRIDIDGTTLNVGAGAPDVKVAMAAGRAGLAGLEFLRGIPGTVGGALVMNAGAYGREIADVFTSGRAVDRAGHIHEVTAGDMGFAYRHTEVPADWIFVDAVLAAERGDTDRIRDRMEEISDERELSQPVKTATGGSTFKNPADGKRAWELIEAAGCRGLTRGGAEVSRQHCNFLVNTGTATAADLEDLGEDVRRRVKEATGVDLQWEIRRIGKREAEA